MSKADWIYLDRSRTILKKGMWDISEPVRPKWSDGELAHTLSVFSDFQRYNLAEEFPIVALRNIGWKPAIDEILWIYQQKSNNINDLNAHVWDQWADENGAIGKAYGYQVAQKYDFPEGHMDQMDRILYLIKNKPADRRKVLTLWNPRDLKDMALTPCAYEFYAYTKNNTLSFFLNQRSNDLVAAGSWNVVQYSALAHMLAHVNGYKVGEFTHHVADSHIYDRHLPFTAHLIFSRAKDVKERAKQWSRKLTPEQNQYLDSLRQNENTKQKYNEMLKCMEKLRELCKVNVDFDKLIEEAEYYEVNPTNYQEYAKKISGSRQFEFANRIVDLMLACPELEKMLGYSSPKLELDENVTDFYDFKSPKMRDENRKIIDNPQSSFKVKDYHPETEGVKFKARVPVAE